MDYVKKTSSHQCPLERLSESTNNLEMGNISFEQPEKTTIEQQGEPSGVKEDFKPPRKLLLVILTIALMFSVFMIALDTNIIGAKVLSI